MLQTSLGVLLASDNRLMSLNAIDLIIIVLYFVLVLGLGVYLRKFASTGEDFFWPAGK